MSIFEEPNRTFRDLAADATDVLESLGRGADVRFAVERLARQFAEACERLAEIHDEYAIE